jgi:hypothetical protein
MDYTCIVFESAHTSRSPPRSGVEKPKAQPEGVGRDAMTEFPLSFVGHNDCAIQNTIRHYLVETRLLYKFPRVSQCRLVYDSKTGVSGICLQFAQV